MNYTHAGRTTDFFFSRQEKAGMRATNFLRQRRHNLNRSEKIGRAPTRAVLPRRGKELCHRLGSGVNMKLFVNAPDVGPDSDEADAQLVGNLFD